MNSPLCIEHRTGAERSEVVLICSAIRRLILSLAYYLQQQGLKRLVITATPQVRLSFEKLNLGLNLYTLAAATSEKTLILRLCSRVSYWYPCL